MILYSNEETVLLPSVTLADFRSSLCNHFWCAFFKNNSSRTIISYRSIV
tara:strand:- start:52 stop:198 length:147 start_codon:yes stop_codon:yes gene_type:complete